MSETFLHGVETITNTPLALVNTVKTAVIGLIGTAATGDANKIKVCITETDDATFGTTGSIPDALAIIREITKKTGATVMVVSVGTGTPAPEAADFVGDLDADTGARTGLRCFDLAFSTYGFNPKIFIAPSFSSVAGVKDALDDVADKFRGFAYVDSPTATIPSDVISVLRAALGLWIAEKYRTKLLYPGVLDAEGDVQPFSTYAAANRALIDATDEKAGGGWWVSSSNKVIEGITGSEIEISASINDVTAETNLLNAVGVTTIFNNSGRDFREWGNRNSAYPTKTDPLTFECCQRAKDIIDESIELAMLPYIDKPIIQAYIDSVRQTVNNYFNVLIARGAALEGSICTYDPAKNSSVELAKGHVVFTTTYMTPTPAERITFDTSIDTSLLDNLK